MSDVHDSRKRTKLLRRDAQNGPRRGFAWRMDQTVGGREIDSLNLG